MAERQRDEARRVVAAERKDLNKIPPVVRDMMTEIAIVVAKLNPSSCLICRDECELSQGVLCNAAVRDDAHFVCDECLSSDVQQRQSTIITADDHQIRCCMTSLGCESRPFANQDIASHCTAEAFKAFQGRLEEIREAAQERQVEARLKALQDKLLSKTVLEMEVMIARKHIEEEIILLRCPNGECRQVFFDFNGCAALSCRGDGGEAGCGANFCGFCLVECGADAHGHVANCSLNPSGDVFPPPDMWQRAMQQRRRVKLQAYWDGLKDSVRRQLGRDASVRQIFTDLGLPLPPEAAAADAAATHFPAGDVALQQPGGADGIINLTAADDEDIDLIVEICQCAPAIATLALNATTDVDAAVNLIFTGYFNDRQHNG